ncbi:MAG: hypothetical protein HYS15_03240, partial [Candidatus Spechtbacteria bacterium]|nr:hypothetical protein [Candidatus Spechtbacteria bacterium]
MATATKTLPVRSVWDPAWAYREFETTFTKLWLPFPKQLLMERPMGSEGPTSLELLELRGNSSPVDFLNESVFFQRDYADEGQEPELH